MINQVINNLLSREVGLMFMAIVMLSIYINIMLMERWKIRKRTGTNARVSTGYKMINIVRAILIFNMLMLITSPFVFIARFLTSFGLSIVCISILDYGGIIIHYILRLVGVMFGFKKRR